MEGKYSPFLQGDDSHSSMSMLQVCHIETKKELFIPYVRGRSAAELAISVNDSKRLYKWMPNVGWKS